MRVLSGLTFCGPPSIVYTICINLHFWCCCHTPKFDNTPNVMLTPFICYLVSSYFHHKRHDENDQTNANFQNSVIQTYSTASKVEKEALRQARFFAKVTVISKRTLNARFHWFEIRCIQSIFSLQFLPLPNCLASGSLIAMFLNLSSYVAQIILTTLA